MKIIGPLIHILFQLYYKLFITFLYDYYESQIVTTGLWRYIQTENFTYRLINLVSTETLTKRYFTAFLAFWFLEFVSIIVYFHKLLFCEEI